MYIGVNGNYVCREYSLGILGVVSLFVAKSHFGFRSFDLGFREGGLSFENFFNFVAFACCCRLIPMAVAYFFYFQRFLAVFWAFSWKEPRTPIMAQSFD